MATGPASSGGSEGTPAKPGRPARRWLPAREWLVLGAILVLALGVRLAFHDRTPVFLSKDSQTYYLPAWDFAQTGSLDDLSIRRTALYPAFIALVIRTLGEDPAWLALAQHLVGLVTVAATYALGRLTFGWLAGAVAALAIALNGPLLIYERYVMSETLFVALVALALVAALLVLRRPTRGRLIAAGVLLALAIQTRPIGEAVVPLLPLALLLQRRAWRPALVQSSWFALGLALVMVPSMARNALAHGSFSSEGALGQALIGRTIKYDDYRWYYSCPPSGDSLKERVVRVVCEEGASDDPGGGIVTQRLRQQLGLSQGETTSILLQVGLEAIARNPVHYVQTTSQMAWEMFQAEEKRETLRDHLRLRRLEDTIKTFSPGAMKGKFPPLPRENRAEVDFADALTRGYRPSSFLPLLLVGMIAAVGLGLWRSEYRLGLFLAAAVATLLLTTAALNGPPVRYRYPVDPLVAVLAAGGLIAGARLAIQAVRRPRSIREDAVRAEGRLPLAEAVE